MSRLMRVALAAVWWSAASAALAQSPVTVTPTAASFLGGGGSGSFTISAASGTAWTVSADPWIVVSWSSGTGTQTVTYSVSANASGSPARTGMITVTSAGGSASLTVSEAAWVAGPPTATILNPLTNGELPAHQPQQTIQLRFDSPNGAGHLNYMLVTINNAYSFPYPCHFQYYPQQNAFYFFDGNTATGYTLGTAGQIATSIHCGIDIGASSAVLDQNGVTLNMAVTLRPSALGEQNVYPLVFDNDGNSNWFPGSVASWLANDEITKAPPSVAMTPPTTATGQTLYYRFSSGNGYTYLHTLSGVISADPSRTNAPCRYRIALPNFLDLSEVSNGVDVSLGWGYIGGGSSSTGTGVIGAPGKCRVDLNNSRIHINPDAGQPDPDPNSGVYPTIYLDLATTLDPAAAAMLPMNVYLSAEDMAWRIVDNALAGTWLNVTTATPTFSPAAGTYTSAQSVTISSSTPGASIRYTTDGSTPSATNGTVYTGPFSVSSTTTVKAVAYLSGWSDSAVVSAVYAIVIPTTVATSPSGLSLMVDNLPCTTPCSFEWAPNSSHTLAAVAQSGGAGVQYAFATWSDNGAASHTVTAPSSAMPYTATFTTQYYLTTSAIPSSGGTVLPVSGWYNSGAPVTITASPAVGYQFTGFSGNVPGTTTPQNITMNAPATVTGSFTVLPATLAITSAHTGSFMQGETGDVYTLTVTNTGPGPTNGTVVTVSDTVPPGIMPTSMAGTGWTCAQPAGPCTRSDVVAPGASYAPITLTVNVALTAAASVTNSVAVAGGGSAGASAAEPTTIVAVPRYATPLAFAATASIVGNVPTTLTVTYASANGASEIASGQVLVAGASGGCYFGWDSTGNVTMYAGIQIPARSGRLGQAGSLYTGTCLIDLANSSLTPVSANPDALDLKLAITFPQQSGVGDTFVGEHEVYAWGTSAGGTTTGQIDLGAVVVSSGQDFTISVTPADSNSIALSPGSSTTVLLTANGLNGFAGWIDITSGKDGSNWSCFVVQAIPTRILANSQMAITVFNSSCPAGSTMQLLFGAYYRNGYPNGLTHNVPASPTFVAGTASDFGVIVGNPSAPVLSSIGSVSYPITLQSINGQAGVASLSVSGMPGGVAYQLDPMQVSVPAGGSASTTLTLTGSASMPGGTFPVVVIGTLNGRQRTASFGLGTQVTAFQVTSVTGSGIVHNNGVEVQVVHSVPAGDAPAYTTCGSPDPDVSCRVIGASAGTVTLGVTANHSAVHGTRVLSLNGGATKAHFGIGDSISGAQLSQVEVTAGIPKWQSITVPAEWYQGVIVAGLGDASAWVMGMGTGSSIPVYFGPPASVPAGAYRYAADLCSFDWEPDGSYCLEGGDVIVDAALVPPPAVPMLQVISNGAGVPQGTCSALSPDQALYIDPAPAMPAFSARIVMSDGSAPVGTATWSLSGSFPETDTRLQPQTWTVNWGTVGPPAPVPATSVFNAPWGAVSPFGFVGGDARIAWTYNGVSQPDFHFCVLGNNPVQSDAMTALNTAAATSGYWFMPYIAIQETLISQFCEPGRTDGADYCRSGANVGWPLLGTPAGYGLMQRDPPSSVDMIWNWRSAIDAGKDEIQAKAGPPSYSGDITKPDPHLAAYPFWIRQVRQWTEYNRTAPADQKVPPPADQVESPACTFTLALDANGYAAQMTGRLNTYWFGDAIVIKNYNGGGNGSYISWDQSINPPAWAFNKANPNSTTYTGDVCSCTNPSGAGCKHSRP